MRIALAQYNYQIGNFQTNIKKITQGIEKAKNEGADLIVFSELSVCGYPSADLLEYKDYLELCEEAIQQIIPHCKDIAAIVGAPAKNIEHKGKPLYNAAYFIEDQKIKNIYHKGLLPNYDVFDEYRYFEPAQEFSCIDFKGKRIALTICEDLWNLQDNPLYKLDPMGVLAQEKPDLMINIAASPFSWNHVNERKKILLGNVSKHKTPLLYVNQVGAQTELIFDGGSMFIDNGGNIREELAYFEEDFRIINVNHESVFQQVSAQASKTKNIHKALILGIKDYFGKLGFKKAILGLSGGIDSAVTLALAAEALGAENVLAVLMPGPFSSDHSVKDAEDLAKNLGCPYYTINISEATQVFEKGLEPWFEGLPFNVAEENIQARSRAVFLMALSNKFGHVLLNTSNKSEAAVGYGTLYGDMCGGLSVLGDVYKTDVFALAEYINRNTEIIPNNSIIKPPSAELRPDQKDSDSLPEYDLLDKLLFEFIENQKGAKTLKKEGFESSLVDKVLRLVNLNEYKRFQTAPVLRVSSKAFGMGRKIPLVAKHHV